jgi:hypothetical protein
LSKPSAEDRRAHPRHTTELDLQGTPQPGGVVARMVARNLSLGGLYCTSTTDFAEMTRLAVRLMLPPFDGNSGREPEPVDVEAVVVRREERRSNGRLRYELALFFTNVEQPARDRLRRYLDDQDGSQPTR